jgi:hypothetical protein
MAALHFNQSVDDGQTEAAAAARFVQEMKRFEHCASFLDGKSRSVVSDPKPIPVGDTIPPELDLG